MEIKEEGFEEQDQTHLLSKQKQKNNKNIQPNPYFIIPDAKPILSKNFIDMNKPKVLIRQIHFYRQPLQLIISKHIKDLFSIQNHLGIRKSNNLSETNIWNKYIVSQNYQCVYLKFYKENIRQLSKKGFKKIKLEFQKLFQYNQYIFSTYIIDLTFLKDVGTYLIQNLQDVNLKDVAEEQQQEQVLFDSKFQCGNLFAAFKKVNNQSNNQYDLILQTDINTKGFSSWFYFSIKSKKRKKFKFNIVNMQKNHSLYSMGMKIAVFSYQKFQKDKVQWHRDGYNYIYSRNELLKSVDSNIRFNTLSFNLDQKYDDDLIFIAMNYPYSYSKLLKYVDNLQKLAKLNSHIYFKKENLTKTLSSNLCPIITLTWKRDKKNQDNKKRKKIIGVIARQHPCQTVSSYVMEGFLNNLLHLNNEFSVELLKRYIFKIIPMINIDGVIYGNSRCDISGTDINRRWTKNPNSYIYPIISAVRGTFSKLTMEGYQIQYFFDLHGHSKKMGTFIYGCKSFDQIQNKQFAWIMSKLNNKFLFEECSFGLSNFKRDTARGSMSNLVLNKKSLTVETSFYGYKSINGNKHFQIKQLQQIGQNLLEAVYAQQTKDPKIINWQTLNNDIKIYIQEYNLQRKQNDASGSDSDPSVDQMTEKQKLQTFLTPQLVANIGLNDIKIVRKISPKKIQRKQSQQIIQAFHQLQQKQNQNKLESLIDNHSSLQDLLARKSHTTDMMNSKPLPFRQSRSVTKITPFKFTQRSRKSNSDFKQRIRIAIDICHLKPQQKLSAPTFPNVRSQRKNQFWQEFNKQYQTLIIQKQTQIQIKKKFQKIKQI